MERDRPCSAAALKNMIPVLDYLGKSGVRHDELPYLLRRYSPAPSPSTPQPLPATTSNIPSLPHPLRPDDEGQRKLE